MVVIPSSLQHTAAIARSLLLFLPSHLTSKLPSNPKKPLSLLLPTIKMSSWACSKCTFINPPSQKSNCQICLSPPPPSTASPPSSTLLHQWSCSSCTFLNPYRSANCEICGTRASASLLSALEVDDDDLDGAQLGSTVFLPLQACSNTWKGNGANSDGGGSDAGFEDEFNGVGSRVRGDHGGFGKIEKQNVGSAEMDSGGKKGFSASLGPCSNKRKDRTDVDGGGGDDAGGSYGFRAVKTVDTAAEVKSLATGENHQSFESKTWKILSYNIWFREDLEMHQRMRALGNLIQLHSPDVICFQEVTPSFYEIFQKSSWWKRYRCSMTEEAIPGAYFCMQLSKLPVKSYSSKPFHNSIMGRELCIAEIEAQPNTPIVVATTHLESPCPSPPKWDQMFSKERVAQAQEAVSLLDKNRNVIFCGDMNWDDKLDGPFPLPDGWADAWKEMKPGEEGWTYDTKSNKMLSGNRALQKRLDRFVCKLRDFKMSGIEMIGKDPIVGLSYVKEKRVKGQVKELVLPVLPSDHYGLLLTITDSTD